MLERVLDTEALIKKSTRLTAADLKAGLKKAEMKQSELAKHLGVSAVMVTYWLKPEDDPKAKTITPKYEAQIRKLLSL